MDLVHFAMHDAHSEVILSHFLFQLLNPPFSVAVDQCLVDVQVWVQINQDVYLPLISFHGDVVLVDAFQGKFLVFHQNLCWIPHEIFGQL